MSVTDPLPPSSSDNDPAPSSNPVSSEPGFQSVTDFSDLLSLNSPDPPTRIDVQAASETPRKIGHYHLIKQIGRGGMGVVYLARQESLNRDVAIKIIPTGIHTDPNDLKRFRAEARMAASLQHPNIVPVYEVGEETNIAYLVMEFVNGGTLHQYINAKPMTPLESAIMLEQIARGMHYAHQKGIIHRDLKPGNILLANTQHRRPDRPEGWDALDHMETHQTKITPVTGSQQELAAHRSTILSLIPKVTDFGLAKQDNRSQSLTAPGVAVGTPSYMAPEQARGDRKEVGPATDVYALGAILYEMLTSKPPFSSNTAMTTMEMVCHQRPIAPSAIRPGIPVALEKICLRCLEKNPRRRYATAESLADALRGFLDRETLTERAAPVVRKWWYPYAASFFLTTVVACVSVLAFITFQANRKAESYKEEALQSRWEMEEAEKKSRQDKESTIEERIRSIYLHGQRMCEEGNPTGREELERAFRMSRELSHHPMLPTLEWNRRFWNEYQLRLVKTATHGSRIQSILLSADGKTIYSAADNLIIPFWQSGTLQLNVPQLNHLPESINGKASMAGMALNPRGDLLATTTVDSNRVHLWNPITQTSLQLRIGLEPNVTVLGLGFLADQQLLIAASDGKIYQWDVGTNQASGTWIVHEDKGVAFRMAIDPKRERIATGDQQGRLLIWEAKKKRERTLPVLTSAVESLTWRTDAESLLIGTQSGMLWIWNDRTETLTPVANLGSAIQAISLSSDGRFAVGTQQGRVQLGDLETMQLLPIPTPKHVGITSLLFTPESKHLVVGDSQGGLHLYTVPKTFRQAMYQLKLQEGKEIRSLDFSANGSILLAVTEEGFGLLQPDTLQPTRPWVGVGPPLRTGALSLDGSRVVVGGGNGELWEYDRATGQQTFSDTTHTKTRVTALLFRPHHTDLLTISPAPERAKFQLEGGSWLWNRPLDAKKTSKRFENLKAAVDKAVFDPTGKQVLLAASDGRAIFWNIDDNTPVGEAMIHSQPISAIAIHPKGTHVITGCVDGSLRIWKRTENGTKIEMLAENRFQTHEISSVGFVPSGEMAYSTSLDGKIRFWALETGLPLGPILHVPQAILCSANMPSKDRFLTGTRDRRLYAWTFPEK